MIPIASTVRIWIATGHTDMRRAEQGHHHHISGVYLGRYAQESAWREDNRRVDNGRQVRGVVHLALKARPSVDFCGYWQRSRAI
jgi:hypothetical protein